MITITDIANDLGISAATVSRALNNSRLVSPDLSQRISKSADKLGYKKRTIRRHRGRGILNIKLVLPRHEEPERALFYDLAALIEGIRSGFRQCSINLVCETATPKFQAFPHKKGGDTNGFIFAFNRPSPSTLKELREIGTPFVILNRQIEGLPCVASENAKGMADIAAHLLNRNPALKPAFITLKSLGQVGEERSDGFAAACNDLGIAFDQKNDVHEFSGISEITSEKIRAIAPNYSAFVCVNDIVGTVILTELDRLGIPIPKKISVTGFDDSPVRKLSRPLLTTVSMPLGELASTAASRLETQIIEHTIPEEIIRIPGILLVGESS